MTQLAEVRRENVQLKSDLERNLTQYEIKIRYKLYPLNSISSLHFIYAYTVYAWFFLDAFSVEDESSRRYRFEIVELKGKYESKLKLLEEKVMEIQGVTEDKILQIEKVYSFFIFLSI